MKKKDLAFSPQSADEFKTNDGYYLFPFTALDSTPGGSNLGRIEWHVELVRSHRKRENQYPIEKLYVWASQTHDERYAHKVFEIPCYAEAITATGRRDSYLHFVWRVMFCNVHKNVIFSAYPKDEHTKFRIGTWSSISLDAEFV